MQAREDILFRVRAALGRSDRNRHEGETDVQAAFAARAQGPRPQLGADLAARFRHECGVQSSTLDEVAALADVPAAVARYLAERGLPPRAVVWPKYAGLPWAAAGVEAEARAARDEDLVGITGCFCAIAETGTLMTCSAPDTPPSTSLLPETHIAVVPVSRIVAGMEDGWALARAELGELPRAVNFISGPSRTGDIEQTIVIGAHGPYRVHLILVREG
ncbi:LutC/YkgG family protein [Pseudothauera rhizosphaerae]|uniref:Lactate utilization protein C n=1 Tax=Pseudothauera rhizosphaerae TaxID=2565932 RepID=A0A4S4AG06_9RHOO|nr:lactate utilization protein C [Pseudothauera rhizosphaerae]THF57697.1 lactate utilization protein C [Pseudothauera rhizosphaerae]